MAEILHTVSYFIFKGGIKNKGGKINNTGLVLAAGV